MLAVLTCGAFAPGIGGGFLNWDDDRFVTDNPTIQRISWQNIREIFSRPHQEAYHPLHLAAYMLQYPAWRKWAPGYKLVSLALYVVCLWLLYRLLLLLEFGSAPALAGVAFFAVHPLHAEAVTWISALKEPLSFVFLLLAALLYLQQTQPSLQQLRPWWKSRKYWAAFALFGAALLTKTSTAVLPALLFAIDVVYRRHDWKQSLARTAPFFVLAGIVGQYVTSLWVAHSMTRPHADGILSKASLVVSSYGHYLQKMVLPIDLSPVYAISGAPRSTSVAIGILGLASFVVVGVRLKSKGLRLAMVWFCVALLPVSNIVPVYFYVQDRYAFIASAGIAFCVATLVRRTGLTRRAVIPGAVLFAALSLLTVFSTMHWRTSEDLWKHATRVQPTSYYAHLGLAHTYRAQGRLAAAAVGYRQAIALRPTQHTARIALCLTDVERRSPRSRRRKAVVAAQQAIQRQWLDPEALVRLSAAFLRSGLRACAAVSEDRAWALRPAKDLEAIQAASRWTLAGDGTRALHVLGNIGPRGDRLGRLAPAYHEIRAQAFILLDDMSKAETAFQLFRKLTSITDVKLRASAAQLRRFGRTRIAEFYERHTE